MEDKRRGGDGKERGVEIGKKEVEMVKGDGGGGGGGNSTQLTFCAAEQLLYS